MLSEQGGKNIKPVDGERKGGGMKTA